MKKHFIIFLFFSCSILGISQFTDSFSDKNFTTSLIWLGDIGNFEIDTGISIVWIEIFLEYGNATQFKEIRVLNK